MVERSLKGAALWDEVSDRLHESALGPLGRAAAAPLHRPRDRRGARRPPDGRAVLRARPDRDREDRGADAGAEGQLHHRDRHPQHAAGRPGVRLHRLHAPGRAGRVRGDQGAVHDAEGSRRPKPTSRAGSARSRRTAMERHFEVELQAIREKLLAMGSLAESDDPQERAGSRRPGRGAGAGGPRSRGGDGSPLHRGGRSLLHAARPAAADGLRSPFPRGQHQDQQRPGADGRPGGEHRAPRAVPDPRAPGQAAHRHPADGRAGAGDGAQEPGRLRAPGPGTAPGP